MAEQVHLFTTGGLRLAADYFAPADHAGPSPGPSTGVVVALGFGSVKEQVAAWGERLSAAGLAVLVPDYRGFGGSEGPPGRIVPEEQVEDLRAALTWLEAQDEVDPSRLTLLGISTGGANAVYAGGRDPRVAAVASIVGWGDGERHLRALRRQHEWLAFRERVDAARTRRVVEGVDERVDPDEILVRDPEAARWRRDMVERFPEMRFDTTLESAERIMEFRPERVLPYPPGRALLVVHAEQDRLIPVEEAHALYARAAEPKRLVILPGIEHHGIHEGDAFEECIRLTTEWFATHAGPEIRP